MEREVKQRAQKDSQDILWEDLEDQFENIRKAYRKGIIKLNEITIEKSALYLKIDSYRTNVVTHEPKTEQQARSEKRKTRKYKANKILDVDMIKMESSVDEFMTKTAAFDTTIDKYTMSNRYLGLPEEENKTPTENVSESNMSNQNMISFDYTQSPVFGYGSNRRKFRHNIDRGGAKTPQSVSKVAPISET